MARIRSLKPTFWTDEKIGVLPRDVRLTFIGLISAMADDHGRLVGSPRIVRGAVYPYDDDVTVATIAEHLAQLADAGRITRYTVNGDDYIQITNWSRHQRVDKPSPSLLPPQPGTVDDESSNNRRTIPTDRKGGEEERKGGDTTPPVGVRVASPAEDQLAAQCGEHYPAIVAFLDERPSDVRDAWAADLLKLVGPATGNLPEDLARACTDGKLATPPVTNAKTLRIFLASCREERLAPARAAMPHRLRANGAQPSARDQATVEAGKYVAQIRELVVDNPIPGQGSRRILRNADVERISPEVHRAYRTVGGASRFLAIDSKPEDLPFLINAFRDALHDARWPAEAARA